MRYAQLELAATTTGRAAGLTTHSNRSASQLAFHRELDDLDVVSRPVNSALGRFALQFSRVEWREAGKAKFVR